MKIRDILTSSDKILITAIIFISLILLIIPFYYFSRDFERLTLKVQQGDKLVKELPLTESYKEPIIFEVEGPIGIHKIEVNQGRFRVLEAPEADPLKICEKTGWVEREGPIIVCVPNSLSLWLESTKSDLDGMSW